MTALDANFFAICYGKEKSWQLILMVHSFGLRMIGDNQCAFLNLQVLLRVCC